MRLEEHIISIVHSISLQSRDHCIIRHSQRYYRHSGLVIYMSKLLAPSVSMPCDYRILQSPTKGQVLLVLWETVGRSHLRLFGRFHKEKRLSQIICDSLFCCLSLRLKPDLLQRVRLQLGKSLQEGLLCPFLVRMQLHSDVGCVQDA